MIVCLGAFAWDAACRLSRSSRSPSSAMAPSTPIEGGPLMLGCFHPSQQNTFTGKLTEPMIDAVFARAATFSRCQK